MDDNREPALVKMEEYHFKAFCHEDLLSHKCYSVIKNFKDLNQDSFIRDVRDLIHLWSVFR